MRTNPFECFRIALSYGSAERLAGPIASKARSDEIRESSSPQRFASAHTTSAASSPLSSSAKAATWRTELYYASRSVIHVCRDLTPKVSASSFRRVRQAGRASVRANNTRSFDVVRRFLRYPIVLLNLRQFPSETDNAGIRGNHWSEACCSSRHMGFGFCSCRLP